MNRALLSPKQSANGKSVWAREEEAKLVSFSMNRSPSQRLKPQDSYRAYNVSNLANPKVRC